jgi:hypothetical protein
MEMVMEMVIEMAAQWCSGSPLLRYGSQVCCVTLLWCALLIAAVLIRIIYGPFTKVSWFYLVKAVEGGTARWYGWALAISMVDKACNPPLRGLFDLGKLSTHKSSLISYDFAQNVLISARRKII